ncbi:MAG TPA: TonB-dependent receptor, partial [Bacillota bacterium]|nr:TonB-dependent receptor [Bacillota bacterium]
LQYELSAYKTYKVRKRCSVKKILVLLTSLLLLLSIGIACLAGTKTIYADISKDENHEDYSPKMGFDWSINDRWGCAFSYQFEGGGDSESSAYASVRYNFPHPETEMILVFHLERTDSLDSWGLQFYYFRFLRELFGRALYLDCVSSYTPYYARDNVNLLDYVNMKIFTGIQYQWTEKALFLAGLEWANYINDKGPNITNYDYQEWRPSVGLLYQFNEHWNVKGEYKLIITECEDSGVDAVYGGTDNIFSISITYLYQKYNFYLEMPFPQDNSAAKIGVSYTF